MAMILLCAAAVDADVGAVLAGVVFVACGAVGEKDPWAAVMMTLSQIEE